MTCTQIYITNLALELRGCGPVFFYSALEAIGFLADEEQQVVLDFPAEDLLGGLLGELNHQGKLVGGDELLDVLGIQVFSQVVTSLIELKARPSKICYYKRFKGNNCVYSTLSHTYV